jgi:hypothetical protein
MALDHEQPTGRHGVKRKQLVVCGSAVAICVAVVAWLAWQTPLSQTKAGTAGRGVRRPPNSFANVGTAKSLSFEEALALAKRLTQECGPCSTGGDTLLARYILGGLIDPNDKEAVKLFLQKQTDKEAKPRSRSSVTYHPTAEDLRKYEATEQGKSARGKILARLLSEGHSAQISDLEVDEDIKDFMSAVSAYAKAKDPEFASKKAHIEAISAKYPGNALLPTLLAQAQCINKDYVGALKSAQRAIDIGSFTDWISAIYDAWRDYGRIVLGQAPQDWRTSGNTLAYQFPATQNSFSTAGYYLFNYGKAILSSNQDEALSFLKAGIGLNLLAENHRELDGRTRAVFSQLRMTREIDDRYVQMIYGQAAAEVHARLEKESQALEKLVRVRDQIYSSRDSAAIFAYEEASSAVGSFQALSEESDQH